MPLRLSPTDYQNLVEVAHSTHDSRQMHRAQALLWLHEGDTVDEVATRLFVTPRTVFRWCSRFHERQTLALGPRMDCEMRFREHHRAGEAAAVKSVEGRVHGRETGPGHHL